MLSCLLRKFSTNLFLFLWPLLVLEPQAAVGSSDTQNLVQARAGIYQENSQNKMLVLYFKNKRDWHTYWKNPGDAGTSFQHSFHLEGQEIEIPAMEWPVPKRYLEQGDLQAYGLSDLYAFFFEITPQIEKKLGNKTLTITSTYLVCKDICVPGKKVIEGVIKGNEFVMTSESKLPEGESLQISPSQTAELWRKIPFPIAFPPALTLTLVKGVEENVLFLYSQMDLGQMTREEMAGNVRQDINFLTPFPAQLLTFKHEELALPKEENGTLYGRMKIEWDGEYAEQGPIPLPTDGKFSTPYTLKFLFTHPQTGEVSVIEKEFPVFISGEEAQAFEKKWQQKIPLLKYTPEIEIVPKTADVKKKSLALENIPGKKDFLKQHDNQKESGEKFLLILLLAFLGGVILNFMPCVLPVISLKLFGLIRHSKSSRKEILHHNLLYTAGVLSAFLILALVIILLQQAGQMVGWGFHLQSPFFVTMMLILLFIFSLNLFGLFEFNVPGGKIIGNLHFKKNHLSDFFSGVLATILSTPCSAPFLGSALTFAFTSSPFLVFIIFFVIGLGLSLPFLLTGFFPQLIKLLPRPGLWMDQLKKFLGLSILLTFLWLYDVRLNLLEDGSIQENSFVILQLNLALLFIFFSFYAQKKMVLNKGVKSILFMLPLLFLSLDYFGSRAKAQRGEKKELSAEVQWENWSEEKLATYKNEGRWVFMDFTAQWCFTCKVNERVVLGTQEFADISQRYKLKLLLADWTKRDDFITQWLKKHETVGVPAYFIQDPQGNIIKLGETISISGIQEKLNSLYLIHSVQSVESAQSEDLGKVNEATDAANIP